MQSGTFIRIALEHFILLAVPETFRLVFAFFVRHKIRVGFQLQHQFMGFVVFIPENQERDLFIHVKRLADSPFRGQTIEYSGRLLEFPLGKIPGGGFGLHLHLFELRLAFVYKSVIIGFTTGADEDSQQGERRYCQQITAGGTSEARFHSDRTTRQSP